MDRRDEIATYGTFLNALPDVDIDTDTMTATFYTEPEYVPPPEPVPSKLEALGAKVDLALAKGVTKLADKLYARELLRHDYHQDFPSFKGKTGSWKEYSPGLRGVVERVRDDGFYSVARLSVDAHKSWQHNHNVQIVLRFGRATPDILQRNEMWLAFFGRPADGKTYGPTPKSWWGVLPFQAGIGKAPCPRY